MKTWGERFWQDHGDRLIFMGLATSFGGGFLFSHNENLVGAGITLLIAVATLCLNKARGVHKEPEEKK